MTGSTPLPRLPRTSLRGGHSSAGHGSAALGAGPSRPLSGVVLRSGSPVPVPEGRPMLLRRAASASKQVGQGEQAQHGELYFFHCCSASRVLCCAHGTVLGRPVGLTGGGLGMGLWCWRGLPVWRGRPGRRGQRTRKRERTMGAASASGSELRCRRSGRKGWLRRWGGCGQAAVLSGAPRAAAMWRSGNRGCTCRRSASPSWTSLGTQGLATTNQSVGRRGARAERMGGARSGGRRRRAR